MDAKHGLGPMPKNYTLTERKRLKIESLRSRIGALQESRVTIEYEIDRLREDLEEWETSN